MVESSWSIEMRNTEALFYYHFRSTFLSFEISIVLILSVKIRRNSSKMLNKYKPIIGFMKHDFFICINSKLIDKLGRILIYNGKCLIGSVCELQKRKKFLL